MFEVCNRLTIGFSFENYRYPSRTPLRLDPIETKHVRGVTLFLFCRQSMRVVFRHTKIHPLLITNAHHCTWFYAFNRLRVRLIHSNFDR
jgi:hypothetical protein